VPGPWYGTILAVKYTLFPTAGAGIWNCCLAPFAAGVPWVPIRAQELAGLVTPGKALNDACWALAPWESKTPAKVMRPAIVFPGRAAGELTPAAALDPEALGLDAVTLGEAVAAGPLAETAAE
jgi:hypothetical protein